MNSRLYITILRYAPAFRGLIGETEFAAENVPVETMIESSQTVKLIARDGFIAVLSLGDMFVPNGGEYVIYHDDTIVSTTFVGTTTDSAKSDPRFPFLIVGGVLGFLVGNGRTAGDLESLRRRD